MKREGYRHPKTIDLADRLGVELTQAIGILELLWDYAADYAPQGNIGRWSNRVIADACAWKSEPDTLVTALVESRWLDKCSVHRLIIHDIEDHAQSWWKSKLSTLGLQFLKPVPAGDETAMRPRSSPDDRAIPDLNRNRNQTGTKPRKPAGVFADVNEATLRDTSRLLRWLARAVAERKLSGSEAVKLNVVAAAERACAAGKNPAALFVDIVKGGKWNLISHEQEAKASQRLKDYERATGPPDNGRLSEVSRFTESTRPKD